MIPPHHAPRPCGAVISQVDLRGGCKVYRLGLATYRISQLAERAGVKPTALRFYERVGLLPSRRSDSGYRLYGDEAVERLRFISSGKHLGLPLFDVLGALVCLVGVALIRYAPRD